MAFKKHDAGAAARKLEGVIESIARQVLVSVYGEKGYPDWGTRLSEIEQVGVEVGDALTRAIIKQAVARQASDVPVELDKHCGHCGRLLEERDPDPHTLTTRRGEVGWMEPKRFCSKCRRAFFPSVQKFGD